MRSLLMFPVCLLFGVRAFAQFNDSVHYYAAFVGSGSVNKTDANSAYLFNNTFRFNINEKPFSLNSTNSWVYGQQNGSLTNNDVTSTLDFNVYHRKSPVYYWGLANYSSSYSLRINSQWQAGAGAACRIIDRDDLVLNLSDGILYESSDIYLGNGDQDEYHTFRNSFRLMLRWQIKDILKLTSTSFVQHSLSDGSDYIVKANLALSVRLRKWLSLSTIWSYNEVSRTGKENFLFTYGLTVERYF